MKKQPHRHNSPTNQFLDREDPILKQFLSEVSRYPVLSNNEIVDLISYVRSGDESARDKIASGNYRLLVRIAKDFQSINLSINDLIQEGYIGLNDAINKFDPDKQVPFAHFASWWIKMRIIKYIWWYQTTVRLPETQRAGINKLLKISTKFIAETGMVPSMEELLESSGLSEKMVNNYCNLFNYGNMKGLKNIDDLDEEGRSIIDTGTPAEELVDRSIITQAIAQCLDTLHEKHQEFLRDYYGIGRTAIPVHEMARRCGTTTENVRQKRARLVKYLKQNCVGMLAPYADI